MNEKIFHKRVKFDPSSWKIPYGTMMLLCMIFFLILYSFAYISGINYEKVLAQLQAGVKGEKQALKEIELVQNLEKAFKADLEKQAGVSIDARRIRIFLKSPVLFDSGSARLKKEAKKSLHQIAEVLRNMDNKVIVAGHTDNIPFKKLPGGNFELSTLRAFNVIKYFIDEEGLSPQRFSAFGFGPYSPIASNDTPQGRAKNRRIEISILRK
ncbi:MAG: flagellar motor protein MotB [Elusimicrobia bacterium]|nr:flagellar motor protein MotB [Elusimicrobiota bacterium]